jgi:hypothetical protein
LDNCCQASDRPDESLMALETLDEKAISQFAAGLEMEVAAKDPDLAPAQCAIGEAAQNSLQ